MVSAARIAYSYPKPRLIAGALLLGCLATISAQTGAEMLTLDEGEAVRRALDQNLTLAQRRVSLESSARSSKNAWNALLPSLNASASLTRNNTAASTPVGGRYHEVFSAQLQAQVVFSIAAIEGIETARLNYASALISYDQAAASIATNVRKLFYNLILLEQQIVVTQQGIATASQTLAQTDAKFRGGLVAEITVRRAEVALENSRLTLARQNAAYRDMRANFLLLLGSDSDDDRTIELQGTIEAPPVPDLARIAAAVDPTDRWDIQVLDARIAAQRSLNRANRRRDRTPTVTLGASYAPALADPFNPNRAANDPRSEWNDGGSLRVTVTVPLHNYLPFSAGAVGHKNSRAALQALVIQRRSALDTAHSQTETLLRRVESSRVALESLALRLTLAQEIYELTLDAYRGGTTDFLAVQKADDDLETARYTLLAERFTYLSTLIDLEYALNTPIRSR